MTSPSTAVLYVTHFYGPEVDREWRRLRADVGGELDAFLVHDVTGSDSLPEAVSRGEHVVPFRQPEVWRHVRGSPSGCPENLESSWDHLSMWFQGQRPTYDYYWFVEYDVRFTGSWRTLFGHFSGSSADLLGTTLCRRRVVPQWVHWSSLRVPDDVDGRPVGIRGFFPIYRISRRGLSVLREAYRDGWRGHFEAVIPTVLHHRGLEIEDFGGDGEFVRPGNENRFYLNTPQNEDPDVDDELSPGTFVYRPVRTRPGDRPDTLWHPVKPPETAPWRRSDEAGGSGGALASRVRSLLPGL